MKAPSTLMYQESHEWVKIDGNIATIGITDYAQDSLGDVVYVELPEVGDETTKDINFGTVESVKAASDLMSPVNGTVIEVNEAIDDEPESINEDPYTHWMIKVELKEAPDLSELLDADAYLRFCEENDA